MNDLTKRQRQTLTFISDSIRSAGFPPTFREMGRHLNIRSTNGVCDHLRALERKGYIVRSDMKSRGLRLTAKALASFQEATPDVEIDLIVIRNRETGLFASAFGLEWRDAPHCWSSLEAARNHLSRIGVLVAEYEQEAHFEWLRVAEITILRARLCPIAIGIDHIS
jgi:DNA-binding MarR family transcriptional regulator